MCNKQLSRKKIDVFTHFENVKVELENNSIELDLKDFEKEVHALRYYNQEADYIFSKIKHSVIEYNDIQDNPNNIYKILDIDFQINDFQDKKFSDIPTKTNLDYKTAIKNYSELIKFAVNRKWRRG